MWIRDESMNRSIKLRLIVVPLHGGYNYREDSKEKTTREEEEVAARNEGSSTAVSGKVAKRERERGGKVLPRIQLPPFESCVPSLFPSFRPYGINSSSGRKEVADRGGGPPLHSSAPLHRVSTRIQDGAVDDNL